MRVFPFLLLLIIVVPIAEMALLFAAAGRFGVIATVAMVVTTAVIGSALVSRQGRGQIEQVRRSFAGGAFPAAELAHGAMILVAAALLITPGFLTDTIGFLLLVPPVREGLRRFGVRRMRNRVQIL